MVLQTRKWTATCPQLMLSFFRRFKSNSYEGREENGLSKTPFGRPLVFTHTHTHTPLPLKTSTALHGCLHGLVREQTPQIVGKSAGKELILLGGSTAPPHYRTIGHQETLLHLRSQASQGTDSPRIRPVRAKVGSRRGRGVSQLRLPSEGCRAKGALIFFSLLFSISLL